MKRFAKVMALVLALSTILSISGFAGAAQARNSDYIDSYRAYMYSPGNSKAQVWFELKANTTSDKVGAQTIFLQVSDDLEDWTTIKTFKYNDYPNMMASDTISNVTYVEEDVESGHYYRGGVLLYVEDDGGSDSRFYTTKPLWI